ncbi:hypothetical protein CLV62_12659 [Dysgonomonas alginatilytica]|uniref:Uncharacterized protein n=1 Tax=Dysgonomonas alginatilytica TaxID=1605892 RepID=A0A2V3PLV5_9BACT|nr:hypothetical protein CLV62_12659 [Dysgonomonas alginatilytica]
MNETYFLIKSAHLTSGYEVHKKDCKWLYSTKDQTLLGYFPNRLEAIEEAKRNQYTILHEGTCCTGCRE